MQKAEDWIAPVPPELWQVPARLDSAAVHLQHFTCFVSVHRSLAVLCFAAVLCCAVCHGKHETECRVTGQLQGSCKTQELALVIVLGLTIWYS